MRIIPHLVLVSVTAARFTKLNEQVQSAILDGKKRLELLR